MKLQLLKQSLLLYLLCTVMLIVPEQLHLAAQESVDNVYTQVRYKGETFIVSLTAGLAQPNLLVSSDPLPKHIRGETISISPNGLTLFAIGEPTSIQPFPLYYTSVEEPFPENTFYGYSARASVSADSKYLFYISIDSTGLLETYNFLNLENGNLTELVGSPLTIPNTLAGITEAAMPVVGWKLDEDSLIFTAQLPLPGSYEGVSFYRMDLSGIDFTQPGSYAMPERTEIIRFDRDIGAGYLSPDGRYIAYLQYASEAKEASDPDLPPELHMLELTTGNIDTIYARAGEFSNLMWQSESGKLIYLETSDEWDTFKAHAYDPNNRENQLLPLDAAGAIVQGFPMDAAVCGNTLFYTARDTNYVRSDILYSIDLEGSAASRRLLIGDYIEIFNCAPDDAWSAADVSECVPYCMPMPMPLIDREMDVTSVNLEGGDLLNGERLYEQFSCLGCHQNPMLQIAPPLTDIYQRVESERLTDPLNAGSTVREYLAQSILQPGAYIVPGYQNLQPNFFLDQMSLNDLRDLVTYLVDL